MIEGFPVEDSGPDYIYDERRAEKRYLLYMYVGSNVIDPPDAQRLSCQKTPLRPDEFTDVNNIVQESRLLMSQINLDDPENTTNEYKLFFNSYSMLKIIMASNKQIIAEQVGMNYRQVSISAGGISFPIAGSAVSGIWGNNFNLGDLVRVTLMGASDNLPPLYIDVVGKILRIDLKKDDEEATEANLAIQFAYGSPDKKLIVDALISSHL